uniref:BTB domain-containing protein n=1 Tax=Rhabditophanes sp. KR3021 TaxID=114890 RepID=A0AC35TLY7_9BILA
MAATSHGIHRINRHTYLNSGGERTMRLDTYIQKQKMKTFAIANNEELVPAMTMMFSPLEIREDVNLLDSNEQDNKDDCSSRYESARNVHSFRNLKANYLPMAEDYLKSTAAEITKDIPDDNDRKDMAVVANGFDQNKALHNDNVFLKFNVGGARYMLRIDTILERGVGRLYNLIKASPENRYRYSDAFFEDVQEAYFERDSVLFHIVYTFYISGNIHQPNYLCPRMLLEELNYWQIKAEDHMALCCCYMDSDPHPEIDELFADSTETNENEFKHLKFGPFRYKIWCIIEEPTSSVFAQIFAMCSIFFVLVSISGLVLSSIPDLQTKREANITVRDNATGLEKTITTYEMDQHIIFTQLEYICIFWFSFEYISKILVAPQRLHIMLQLLNIIDLLSILPFVVDMGLYFAGINSEQLRDLKAAFLVVRILRVLRVIRVLKLGRYSTGLQMFGRTLHASCRQLAMMAMVVATGVIFFATLIYYLEKEEPETKFTSIPMACWFCIVTMSTCGYGDLFPTTALGKIVTTGAICCGVLVLALPITIIVDNFMKVAEGQRRLGEVEDENGATSGQPQPPQPTFRRIGPKGRIEIPQQVVVPNGIGTPVRSNDPITNKSDSIKKRVHHQA